MKNFATPLFLNFFPVGVLLSKGRVVRVSSKVLKHHTTPWGVEDRINERTPSFEAMLDFSSCLRSCFFSADLHKKVAA